MAIEYDFASGFDFSSLSSISAAQTMQAVNQIAPLSNKGLVIWSSTAPDVINNPRYARYLWVDTSGNPYVTKFYDGAAWTTIAPGASGITNAMIATAAVSLLSSDGVTYKITRAYNDANDVTKARYLLWLDANGKRVEIASLASVLAAGSAFISGVAALGIGGDNQILKMNGNTIGWEDQDVGGGILDYSIALNKIVKGGNSQLLLTDVNGLLGYVDVIDPLSHLEDSGASALQVFRKNAANTALEWGDAVYSKEYSASAVGTLAAGTQAFAHGLGVMPKNVRAVLVNVNTEGGWAAGDEMNIENVFYDAGGGPADDGTPMFNVGANTVNIYIACVGVADMTAYRRDTFVRFTLTAANWRVKVYATC